MKVSGERYFDAPVATVWQVLNDPAQMAKMMPGVESFDIQDDKHWRAHMKIPLGLGGLRMSIDFEKTEERKPEFAKLHAKGNGVGAIMNMDTAFNLSETAGGGTDMKWEAEVHILGPVASMGQRVLQPIVNQQVSQGKDNVTSDPDTCGTIVTVSARRGSDPAVRIGRFRAGGLWNDRHGPITPRVRPWYWGRVASVRA